MTFQPVEENGSERAADMPDQPANPSKHEEERPVNDVTKSQPSTEETRPERPQRKWMPLAVTLVIGAGMLGWEYRETLYPLLASPALFLLVCVGMHFLMHRGHGGHGGGGSGS